MNLARIATGLSLREIMVFSSCMDLMKVAKHLFLKGCAPFYSVARIRDVYKRQGQGSTYNEYLNVFYTSQQERDDYTRQCRVGEAVTDEAFLAQYSEGACNTTGKAQESRAEQYHLLSLIHILYDKTRIMGRRYEGTHRFLSGYRWP